MSRLPIVVLLVSTGLWSACKDVSSPDFQLPEPDASLDPSRLSVGEYVATPCGFSMGGNRLDHLRGKHEWKLVDVFFGQASSDARSGGPTEADLELLESNGAIVHYTFNVPAVRAHILISRIPSLVEDGYWVTVREVPDAHRYDIPALRVGYSRPLQDSDNDVYVGLGGRVDHRLASINALSGVLPDQSVLILRQYPDVEYVHAMSVACSG